MVKAVLFDLYETLITECLTRPPGVSSLSVAFGCEREPFRKQWKALRSAVTIGQLSFADALQRIATALGSPADEVTLERVCAERTRMKGQPFAKIEHQVLSMLDRLRSRHVRVGVISNCWAEDVAAWPHSAIASRVDTAVFSFDVGLAKPDPAIYVEALRRLQVDASDACFIGDGADDELSGAQQVGLEAFKALWFLRRWPQFQEQRHAFQTFETTHDVVRFIQR